MAWTNYQLVLAGMMVVTGSINTLSTKCADNEVAMGTERTHLFNHPFLQAVGMFMGEFFCLIIYIISRCCYKLKGHIEEEEPVKFNPLIFLPPAIMDMCGTSLMYIGLNMTYASSFQIFRGAVIIFTALLSVAMLHRTITSAMWVGIVVIIGGLALRGVADMVFGSNTHKDRNGIITGDLLIIAARVITASQMVYEEKFVNKHNVHPLKAVGLEGLFGMTILGLLLIPFYYIDGGNFSRTNPGQRLEDPIDAFTQMGNNYIIVIATVGNTINIAFFNFFGMSMTKEISATTRMVLDSLRTMVIWAVSLGVGWQHFHYLQLIGFLLILFGMCLYNNIIVMPFIYNYVYKREPPPEMLDIPPSLEYSYAVTAPLLSPHVERAVHSIQETK